MQVGIGNIWRCQYERSFLFGLISAISFPAS